MFVLNRFSIVGYGCMTCIGNSGPLPDSVVEAIDKVFVVERYHTIIVSISLTLRLKTLLRQELKNLVPETFELCVQCCTCVGSFSCLQGDLVAVGVLSGNRNFEGRINPHTRANYLASPLLCIAYALAGTVKIDFNTEPLGALEWWRLVSEACLWK